MTALRWRASWWAEPLWRTWAVSRGDAVVAAIAVTLDIAFLSDAIAPVAASVHTAQWLVLAWALVAVPVVLWRRVRPLPVLAVLVLHAVVVSLTTSYRPVVLVAVALESVTARCNGRQIAMAYTLCVAATVAWVGNEGRTTSRPVDDAKTWLIGLAYFGLLLGVGGIGAWQRAGVRERRALARRGEVEARLAVAAERGRMARELHDIVGHAVTVMMLHAAGARRVMAADPARADDALQAVDELGVQAMGELRRLLGLLRAGDPEAVGAAGPADLPGLADLPRLLESFRAAGVEAQLSEQGRRERLDPSVDLTCYRVVQEALTNVAKHAGAARTAVRVDWARDVVTVGVDNEPASTKPVAPRVPGGSGLIGLRERVRIVGGSLDADAKPDGGYRVSARLPCVVARAAREGE